MITQWYREYIWQLEDEYGIQLTDRERHILGLTPNWASRALFYLPEWLVADTVEGRARDVQIFQTPFADAVSFYTDIQADGGEARVVIDFK